MILWCGTAGGLTKMRLRCGMWDEVDGNDYGAERDEGRAITVRNGTEADRRAITVRNGWDRLSLILWAPRSFRSLAQEPRTTNDGPGNVIYYFRLPPQRITNERS